MECGAAVHFGFRPDLTIVLFYDPLSACQSDADAGKIFSTMQTLKYLKEPVGILHVEPHAVVGDGNHRFAIVCAMAYLNGCALPPACEFDSVGQQIRENRFQ